jgi:hypothetical protein
VLVENLKVALLPYVPQNQLIVVSSRGEQKFVEAPFEPADFLSVLLEAGHVLRGANVSYDYLAVS